MLFVEFWMIEANTPATVCLDPSRLVQVAVNISGNKCSGVEHQVSSTNPVSSAR